MHWLSTSAAESKVSGDLAQILQKNFQVLGENIIELP
jgi:hypothetical protein